MRPQEWLRHYNRQTASHQLNTALLNLHEDDQCTCVCKTMEPLAMTGKSSPSLTAVYKLSLLVSSLVL